MEKSGTLYIVATPIGNLEDITYRAARILGEVSVIAAEDTRRTRKLLSHLEIHTRLTSLHEHNEKEKSMELIKKLEAGEDVALVSDAGTPLISDPGYRLVSMAVENAIRLVPIPAASALTAGLSISGLPTDSFIFVGFLPDKKGKRRKHLEELGRESRTLIFYISKWKIEKTLEDMLEIFGDRRVCYCRELTKINEEILHITISALLNQIKGKSVKGEITLIVEGGSSPPKADPPLAEKVKGES